MGFASGYEFDLFVSYARANDHSGWVTRLVQRLEAVLSEKLGGQANVFFDRAELPLHEELSPAIKLAAEKSATLVVVLSDAYLASKWCQEELRLFCASREKSSGAVFLVVYDEVAIEDKPLEIRDVPGYVFFQRDPTTKVCMPLDVSEREFNSQLYFLRSHLVTKLKQQVESEVTCTTAERSVVLAHSGRELATYQRDLLTFLEQLDWRVILLDLSGENTSSQIADQLRQAVAFVRLVGNAEPNGSSQVLDLAHQVFGSDEILQWRLSPTETPIQHELCDCVGEFEEFKSFLLDRLEKLTTRKKLMSSRTLPSSEELPQGTGMEFVLLKASESDESVASDMADLLLSNDIGFDMDLNGLALHQAFDACEYDGILLIYGDCPQEWVQRRIRECRNVLVKSKAQMPECAVYVASPAARPLRAKMPKLRVIESSDDEGLREFIQALVQRGGD